MRDANDTQYVLREAVAFSPLSIARMVNGGAFLPEPDNAHLSGARIGYRGSGVHRHVDIKLEVCYIMRSL